MKITETKKILHVQEVDKILSKTFGKSIFNVDLSKGQIVTTYWNERIMNMLRNLVEKSVLETKLDTKKYVVTLKCADFNLECASWYATIETYHKNKLVNTDYIARIYAYVDNSADYANECFYVASYGCEKYSLFRKAKSINKGYITTFATSNYSDNGEYVMYIDDEIDRRLKFEENRFETKFNNGNLDVREAYSFDNFMRVVSPVNAPSETLINTINDILYERYEKDNPCTTAAFID